MHVDMPEMPEMGLPLHVVFDYCLGQPTACGLMSCIDLHILTFGLCAYGL